MGIYTNYSNNYISSSRYSDVQPFIGESFNYHELGIIAASEIAANHNTFMKSIALSELAAFEQTGSTDVLYESVNLKGIFEKIKMFFKKIIEKIHKIFHTFIAKMSSWFGSNSNFAKKYEKEVVKKWANVKNDWEFKGYKFSHINLSIESAENLKLNITEASNKIRKPLSKADLYEMVNIAKEKTENDDIEKNIKDIRDKMDDIKDKMRKSVIEKISKDTLPTDIETSDNSGLDSSEFTEELFKIFRSGEDSKEDIPKNDILNSYGGSISGMMTYIKEFDKIKSKTESAEKKITGTIDTIIKNIDKAQNELLKDNKDTDTDTKTFNEHVIQLSSLFQSLYGFFSEILTQAFSAFLQAQKEACSQAKEIAVKVIGQSKKMTEESYDYSNDSYTGFDFISSVKLV